MIAIIDYDCGNIASISNMFKKIGVSNVALTRSVRDVEKASKIILPGVGSYDSGMGNLKKYGLIDVLNHKVLEEKVPTLGICLGMQLMAKGSEEGQLPGLGWFDAQVVRFRFPESQLNLKIPHMGWNYISVKKSNALLEQNTRTRFYFVHSYYIKCQNPEDILFECNYGFQFTCGVARGNIYGAQFHPEKSHKFGMQLLLNFSKL